MKKIYSPLEIAQIARGNTTEISYKCLCCNDSYYVNDHYVRQHFDPEHGYKASIRGSWYLHSDPNNPYGYQVTDVPYVCTRQGCTASHTLVDVVNENGVIVRKNLPRLRDDRYVFHLPPDVCQRIHEANLAILRGAEGDAKPDIQTISDAIKTIAVPSKAVSSEIRMQPISAVITNEPEIIDTIAFKDDDITEVDGFKCGDRVVVCIDHLMEHSQKEIRKGNEFPIGEVVIIESFYLSQLALGLGEKAFFARVKSFSGKVDIPCDYLRHGGAA